MYTLNSFKFTYEDQKKLLVTKSVLKAAVTQNTQVLVLVKHISIEIKILHRTSK